jgi:aspartate kinase
VSLVGQGVLEDRRVLRAALQTLRAAGVAVHGVSTSSFRVTFLVPPGPGVEGAARALHAAFVETERAEGSGDAFA